MRSARLGSAFAVESTSERLSIAMMTSQVSRFHTAQRICSAAQRAEPLVSRVVSPDHSRPSFGSALGPRFRLRWTPGTMAITVKTLPGLVADMTVTSECRSRRVMTRAG